ncbi:MAG: hypothetical protein Q8Q81_15895, partial [Oxalobacteraceae bacterium]|nr:hypothetical protein [Oxalobacteraceae bacterium]
TKVNRKIHLLQNIMAQHFTFLSDPSIHAGLRATKGQKRQKSDKDGLSKGRNRAADGLGVNWA